MEMAGPPRSVVVAMKGHPGTGKSTLATAIAAALRCPLLDKDDIRDATFPLQHSTSSSSAASSVLNDLSYAVLWRIAVKQLRLRLPFIVVDSPLSRRAHLDRLLHAASRSDARIVVVECVGKDENEWLRRLENRAAEIKEEEEEEIGGWHKPATWAELRKLVEGYGGNNDYELGGVPRIMVDTTAKDVGAAEMLAGVLEFIKSHAQ